MNSANDIKAIIEALRVLDDMHVEAHSEAGETCCPLGEISARAWVALRNLESKLGNSHDDH